MYMSQNKLGKKSKCYLLYYRNNNLFKNNDKIYDSFLLLFFVMTTKIHPCELIDINSLFII